MSHYIVKAHSGRWLHMPVIPAEAIDDLIAGLVERPDCRSFYYDHDEGWIYLRGGTSKRQKIARIP